MTISRTIRRAAGAALRLCALALPISTPAVAQLRPLDPLMWGVFEGERTISARIGVGGHRGQRASLAGTEGDLLEVGNLQATWRTGRVAIEIGGTALRLFRDESVFAAPFGGAIPERGPDRVDSGDYHIATIVRLTPAGRDAMAVLRFGTRLPNSNNRIGLDRDRTDFFALAGGRLRRGGLTAGTEIGLGIFGSHDLRIEQADVLAYALGAEYGHGPITPVASLVGHYYHGRRTLRGNEDLGELRVGARVGRRYWMEVQLVRGLTAFSPGGGLLVSGGLTR